MAIAPIRVGIIGANPERGWAARAHVPALRALPEYVLTAVGTSRERSAGEAARRFGAAHAFTDPRRLAGHPEVDLVVITVKVPAHAELVGAALAAGKHVYCEWPLARTTEEAAALVAAAGAARVRHVIGLQARYAPAVAQARELIAAGRLGRITAVTVYAARGKAAGGRIPGWAVYTLDRANGAGLLEVAGGHTLDAVAHVLRAELAELVDVSATLAVQHPTATVAETGERVDVTSPDHLLLHGRFANGALLSAHIHDGKAGHGHTRIEISGTEGDLTLLSAGPAGPAGVQIGELLLLSTAAGASGPQELPIAARHRLPDPGAEARNVAGLYARLAEDLREGTRTTPDFTDGLRLHRLLDTVRASAADGAG
ncbi:Gfo/Idh/MocA family protein [Kitasatospora purpeofusca]|uniref:Gfo/Idh/MocA family protein n=1 Tax=Kitasatospora purpeofusca TaxID=67352 RepID=UPI0036D3A6F5